jgi:hypothetical protein
MATARMLDTTTASHSLGEVLGLGSVTARELYATLDWLVSEQAFIETALARRHLKEGVLVLYDVTSTYLEGPLLSAGAVRLQPGPSPRPAATGHRSAVCLGWSPCCGRGVRGKHRRSDDGAKADRDTEAALQPTPRYEPRQISASATITWRSHALVTVNSNSTSLPPWQTRKRHPMRCGPCASARRRI